MPRGGARIGAGRPKKTTLAPVTRLPGTTKPDAPAGAGDGITPLSYMLAVLNDPDADASRRDRMAVAAAPYLHPRTADTGAKAERQSAAAKAATGRFATPPSPKLATVLPLRGDK